MLTFCSRRLALQATRPVANQPAGAVLLPRQLTWRARCSGAVSLTERKRGGGALDSTRRAAGTAARPA